MKPTLYPAQSQPQGTSPCAAPAPVNRAAAPRRSLRQRALAVAAWGLMPFILAACGGGGDSAVQVQLSGVAATGAAIAGAEVRVVNAAGTAATARTGADGRYTVDIAEAAPYVLSVVDASGKAWYSYAAGAGTAHITPLTTLALLDANAHKPLTDLVATWASARPTDASVLEAAKKVNANLSALMSAKGVNPTSINVFTSAFAADHTGLDAVLDGLRVAYSCSATACTQSITSPAGAVLLSWNGDIATTGISLTWSASAAGGVDGTAGGTLTVGLGSCKATPVAGTYSLVVQTTVTGLAVTIPEICVDGLPGKPANQTEFCGSSDVTGQLPPGVEIVSCSFDGSSGTINARVTTPVLLDYSIKYSFVLR